MHHYHEVPGRVRVKSPDLKGDMQLCRKAEDVVRRSAGVKDVKASPVTGSIVVKYDTGSITPQAVRELLIKKGYLHPDQLVCSDRHISRKAEKLGQAVGKAVVGAVVEKILEASGLSLIKALL